MFLIFCVIKQGAEQPYNLKRKSAFFFIHVINNLINSRDQIILGVLLKVIK